MNEPIKTILETIKGANNEGSSKRITAAYLCVISLTLLTVTYCFGLIRAALVEKPTEVHIILAEMIPYFVGLILITLAAVLGLTNIDNWIGKIPFINRKTVSVTKEITEEGNKKEESSG